MTREFTYHSGQKVDEPFYTHVLNYFEYLPYAAPTWHSIVRFYKDAPLTVTYNAFIENFCAKYELKEDSLKVRFIMVEDSVLFIIDFSGAI